MVELALTQAEAEQLAREFLVEDLEIPSEDHAFFEILSAKPLGEDWYIVEIGIEGLPDKWVIQVYDTRECDPCYTFVSPVAATESDTGLDEYPLEIAEIIANERQGKRLG
jgi:hypothetical protein